MTYIMFRLCGIQEQVLNGPPAFKTTLGNLTTSSIGIGKSKQVLATGIFVPKLKDKHTGIHCETADVPVP